MHTIIHRSESRGGGDHGWLKTRYSFSFGFWYQRGRLGFGALRVLNDDWIQAGTGFGTHGHENMEIITIVESGTLTHRDSMGNTGVIRTGEVQVMSAGTGVQHSEHNEGTEDLTLFQIWILPEKQGVQPRYDQRIFPAENGETLLVGPMHEPDVLHIHQQAYISRIEIEKDHGYVLKNPSHGVYLFIVDGSADIHGETLNKRDAIGVMETSSVTIKPNGKTTILAIEVPMEF